MVSGLYSGISQSQLSTSESLRSVGIVTCGVCSADFFVGAVVGYRDWETKSDGDRKSTRLNSSHRL